MTIKVGDNAVSSVPTVDVPSWPDMRITFDDDAVGTYPMADVRIEKLWIKKFDF